MVHGGGRAKTAREIFDGDGWGVHEHSTLAQGARTPEEGGLSLADGGGDLGRAREKRKNGRNVDAECRAALDTIGRYDPAAVLLKNAVANAEAEARTFADGFGGVKRIEDALGFDEAGAGVGEFNDDVAAFAHGFDGEHTAAVWLHGVNGITDELEKYLKQLIGVAADGGENAAMLRFDFDVFVAEIESAKLNCS